MGSWLQNDTVIRQDGDFTDFPVDDPFAFAISAWQSLDYATRQLNHELRWTHEAAGFNWIAGVQKFDETAELFNDSQYWVRNPDSLLGPFFGLATEPLQVVDFPVDTRRRTDYLGLFAGVGRDLGDRYRVSLEARWNRDEVEYFTSGWVLEDITLLRAVPGCDPALPQRATLEPGVVNACPETATHSSRQVTPRATLEYRASEQLLFYVAHARGFKPGGYETLEIADFEGRQFRPEKLKAYEAGMKSSWLDNRLILNADIYYNDYTDQQIGIQQVDLETGFAVSRIVNAGKVETLGFETGLSWQATDSTAFSLAYAYTDAEFKEFIQGPARPPAGTPLEDALALFAACGVPAGQTSSPIVRVEAGNACGDFSGNKVGKSPRHAVNASVLHRQPLGATGNHWFAQVSAAHRSERYVDESNLTWLPAYTLVDLQAGIEGERWRLTAYVDNAFDNDRILTAQRNVDFGRPDGFAPSRAFNAYLPQPRLYGMRLSMRFD
jgi:iron complex outermembrane recepter protein